MNSSGFSAPALCGRADPAQEHKRCPDLLSQPWCPAASAAVLMAPSGQAAPPLLEEKIQSLSSSVQLSCCQIPICNASHGILLLEACSCIWTQREEEQRGSCPTEAVPAGCCCCSRADGSLSLSVWAEGDVRAVSGC